MTSWLRDALTPKDEAPRQRAEGDAPENVIPIGAAARQFMESGAPLGQQRLRACACARNLWGAGFSLDDAVDLIHQGLLRSPQGLPPRAPWTWQDAYDLTADIYNAPPPPPPPFAEGKIKIDTPPPLTEEPEEEEQGDTYSFTFAQFDLLVDVSRVEIGRDIFGWMRVTRADAILGEKHVDLSSPNGFTAMIRYLESRDAEVPWPAVLDKVAEAVLSAVRRGEPTVVLNTIQRTERPQYRLNPLIRESMPNLFYGLGGGGKSLLLYYLGLLIQSGTASADFTVIPGHVLLLDWELDSTTVLPTMEALAAGLKLERDRWPVHYRRCTSPLVEEAEEIGHDIKKYNIDVVLIDSLGKASGGDKNSQEVVQRMFGAMRRWPPVTVVALDHVAKQQGKKKADTPYGSVYTLNDVRSAFMVEGSMDDGSNELFMTVRQTKRNFGPVSPIGLRFEFLPDAESPTEIKVTRDKRMIGTAHERIMVVLDSEDNWLTVPEIAMATGMDEKVTAQRLGELFDRGEIDKRKRPNEGERGRPPFEYARKM